MCHVHRFFAQVCLQNTVEPLTLSPWAQHTLADTHAQQQVVRDRNSMHRNGVLLKLVVTPIVLVVGQQLW